MLCCRCSVWSIAPKVIPQAFGQLIFSVRARPMAGLPGISDRLSIAAYLPLHLAVRGRKLAELGRFPLPIQTSRILLYAGYFFVGVGVGAVKLRTGPLLAENGELARRWLVWCAFAMMFYGAILLLVYVHHNWMADLASPPLSWRPVTASPLRCSVPR